MVSNSTSREQLSMHRYSIHGPPDLKAEQRAAEKGLPRVIPGTDNCYLCGFTDFGEIPL